MANARPAPLRRLHLLLVPVAALALGALAAAVPAVVRHAEAAPPAAPLTVPPPGEGWREVDRLVEEQKLKEALELATGVREAAQQRGDEPEWARGLIRETQLRMALHGYETAVRFLREQPWPADPLPHALLDLFYAHSLVAYQQVYGWEIAQREEVASTSVPDLKAWTREQIYGEAQKAFLSAWSQRGAWGTTPVTTVSEFVSPNSYPPEVRGTLRDAVSYLFAELLADSSFWEPRASHEIYRLPLDRLIDGAASEPAGVEAALADPAAHPLARLAALLGDLERWHHAAGRDEAAFEARRQRLEHLFAHFTRREDRLRLRAALEAALAELGEERPWWSLGMETLAQWTRQDDEDPQALVRARELAERGAAKHPDSVGGQRARHVAAELAAPAFALSAMSTDGPWRRSIVVEHRNLPRLWFRAWRLDLDEVMTGARDYNLLPAWQEVPRIVDGREPDAEWQVELPPTPDLRVHRTHVTPPLEQLGLWVIVGSAEEGFRRGEPNRLAAVDLVVTELALLSESVEGGFDVRVLAGGSGRPVAGADVELWRLDWQRGHRRVRTARTDAAGRTSLRWQSENVPHVLVARHGSDVVLDPNHLWPQRRPSEVRSESTLVYTDRSVYRPGQQLHWKAVAYAARNGGFRTLPDAAIDLELVDANGQVVEKASARTNGFGSVAGSFTVPAGRLLGAWQVRSSLGGGAAAVRVEEYKRPTFEVTLREPEAALRLNQPATLRGEARYYFRLPVTAGSVRWTVSRQPIYPWWWGWWWGGAPAQAQIVAAGTSPLREDGTFEVRFTPEADEREAATPGMSYRYALSAEATDEGGETRSANRGFRLGFVAVEARIDPETNFLVAGEPARVTVRRSDLDGAPRQGEGTWRLLRLVEPPRTLLPAEQPLPPDPRGGERYRTPGDAVRPRWQTDSTAEAVLRDWADGAELAKGEVRHGDDGEAELELPALDPGAYRLRYATRDPYGATFETSRELVVAADGARAVALPLLLRVERPSVPVGGTARILVSSGLPEQELALDIVRRDRPVERRRLDSSAGAAVVELPIGEAERGGVAVRLVAVRDHQLMLAQEQVLVPWDDKRLRVELATFRDRLRPGTRETWRVTVRAADEKALAAGAAELLAYMYDRSLDLFAPHQPVDPLTLYPGPPWVQPLQSSLRGSGEVWSEGNLSELPAYPQLTPDRLVFLESWGIGGPGLRHRLFARRGEGAEAMSVGVAGGVVGGVPAPAPPPPPASPQARNEADAEYITITSESPLLDRAAAGKDGMQAEPAGEPVELRSEFAETAFWYPQLLTGPDGSVSFEFTTPDSVTEWNVWLHALTADLRAGSLRKQARTVKELMVRPYLPRFLREGDEAVVQVAVNNAGEAPLAGTLRFEILDPESVDTESERSLLAEFGLAEAQATTRFSVEPGKGTTVAFRVAAPPRVGPVAFRVTARAGDWSDGELRPIPVLPGRMHLVQSRFATLRDRERRVLRLPDLAAAADDPTLIHDQLVVTVDGQLLNTVLEALPYLVDYPYECTEQTLNRFLSTGIVSEVFEDHPPLARLGKELSQRETPLAPWALDDPNRRMELEETPWLVAARGGDAGDRPVLRVLDPKVARAQRDAALAKLRKAQTANGAFPWWPGGPPSPFMTLYMLAGFSRALEFGVDVPQDVVVRAWGYMHQHFLDEMVDDMVEDDCCWELVTFLNFVLSSYPDAAGSGSESWTGGVFTAAERKQMLDFSFRHWKQHSPLSKGHLALSLQRMGRKADAKLVWDSVMDSAQTTEDEGTFWAPEDRAWLWYNDTIETHAFALRVLSELQPADARRHGLVQWLLLNKKLNHWKSTRATAEVLYSLVHYLEKEGALGIEEEARVTVGDRRRTFRFPPDRIGPIVEGRAPGEEARGRSNQLVIPGPEVDPATMADVVVEKDTKGFLFASTTWHFSTEKLPEEARGDLFAVTRTIYRRVQAGDRWRLEPLAEGAPLRPGDQLEVHLSIRSRHAAEYVHLRDPRPAGAEPESLRSGWKWEILPLYEEVRDSGANFFFEWLPAGEYTFKHRLRVAHAGTFRVAPATLQSMYAPEFAAYSAGNVVEVLPAERETATPR